MTATARKIEEKPSESLPKPTVVDEYSSSIASPARALQARLEAAFSSELPEPEIKKLPGAIRLALPFAAAATLWAIIIGGVRMIITAAT